MDENETNAPLADAPQQQADADARVAGADKAAGPRPVSDFMAQYRCHKLVHAGAILSASTDNVAFVGADGTTFNYGPAGMLFARGMAQPGDYLVAYDDGYVSWSPAKAFEDGYALANVKTSDPAATDAIMAPIPAASFAARIARAKFEHREQGHDETMKLLDEMYAAIERLEAERAQ